MFVHIGAGKLYILNIVHVYNVVLDNFTVSTMVTRLLNAHAMRPTQLFPAPETVKKKNK